MKRIIICHISMEVSHEDIFAEDNLSLFYRTNCQKLEHGCFGTFPIFAHPVKILSLSKGWADTFLLYDI